MFGKSTKVSKFAVVRVDYEDLDLVSEYVILGLRHGAIGKLQDSELVKSKVEEVCNNSFVSYTITPVNPDNLEVLDNPVYFVNL